MVASGTDTTVNTMPIQNMRVVASPWRVLPT